MSVHSSIHVHVRYTEVVCNYPFTGGEDGCVYIYSKYSSKPIQSFKMGVPIDDQRSTSYVSTLCWIKVYTNEHFSTSFGLTMFLC